MHNYNDKHGRLPPAAVCGDDGAPLLSWRVLILPYLSEQSLYGRFKLDEPWDSPHNLPLLAEMPLVFTPYNGGALPEPHTTFYQVFVGKGTAFDGHRTLRMVQDFPNGVSNTFLIVEAGRAVPWTKPEDVPYRADEPLPKLGGIFKGSFRAAYAYGSVRSFPQETDETALRALIAHD